MLESLGGKTLDLGYCGGYPSKVEGITKNVVTTYSQLSHFLLLTVISLRFTIV